MKKTFLIVLVSIFSLFLISCENIDEEEKAYERLNNINYETMLNETLNLNFNYNEEEVIIEDEIANLKLSDFNVSINFISNFKTYEKSSFLFELDVLIKGFESDIFGFYAPLFTDVKLKQTFYLKDSNIYSSFKGSFVDATKEEQDLINIYPLLEAMLFEDLDENIKELIESNKGLIENYEEVKENAFTKELYDDLKDSIINIKDIFEMFIDLDLFYNEKLEIINEEDKLSFILNDDKYFNYLNATINLNENNFNSLNLNFKLNEILTKELNFKLYLNNDLVEEINTNDFVSVEELRIEQLINQLS